jgi:hypothetical protein
MVLWEITLATAYVLGLPRTYRLALRLQRRLISPKWPRVKDFVYRYALLFLGFCFFVFFCFFLFFFFFFCFFLFFFVFFVLFSVATVRVLRRGLVFDGMVLVLRCVV